MPRSPVRSSGPVSSPCSGCSIGPGDGCSAVCWTSVCSCRRARVHPCASICRCRVSVFFSPASGQKPSKPTNPTRRLGPPPVTSGLLLTRRVTSCRVMRRRVRRRRTTYGPVTRSPVTCCLETPDPVTRAVRCGSPRASPSRALTPALGRAAPRRERRRAGLLNHDRRQDELVPGRREIARPQRRDRAIGVDQTVLVIDVDGRIRRDLAGRIVDDDGRHVKL
jgi:hypothetical protein